MSEAAQFDPRDVTRLLARYRAGDTGAADELVPLVHGELHRLARAALAKLGRATSRL